ncbi:hypothetical protein JW752_01600 [Candidatus Peregrinibacteria bacterium]|nr:hypothetical protein [Candidatus Peregrinibacteria bacterium]
MVEDARKDIVLLWDQKQKLLDGAVGDEPYDFFLKRLKSFNYRSIRDFAAAFNIRLRRKEEKHDGAAYRKKQGANRRRFNKEIWSDPEQKASMIVAIKNGHRSKKRNMKKQSGAN